MLCSFNIQNCFICSSIRNWIAYANEANIVNKDSPIKSLLSWSIKSHDVDIQVFCIFLHLRLNLKRTKPPMEISDNSHRNFWSYGKRSWQHLNNMFSPQYNLGRKISMEKLRRTYFSFLLILGVQSDYYLNYQSIQPPSFFGGYLVFCNPPPSHHHRPMLFWLNFNCWIFQA